MLLLCIEKCPEYIMYIEHIFTITLIVSVCKYQYCGQDLFFFFLVFVLW
jgi:hypothetical protein